jgi:hypothetical protein
MIDQLDHLLRHLLRSTIAELASDDQVRFQPPDQDWRSFVGTLSGIALNVYLVALAENTHLRSNEVARQYAGPQVFETRAPRRLDCQYLITAWSPVSVSSLFEPTVDEHALLYKTAAVLMNAEPFVPRRIYAPDPLPSGFPDAIADAELPSLVLLADAFPKMAEFWGTVEWRWKPGVYLTVTLPVLLDRQVAGPPVLTRAARTALLGGAAPAAELVQIGGQVLAGAPPAPVGGAWVRLESPAGAALRTASTDDQGRFTFAGLAAGPYTLRVRAAGFAEAARAIAIPSAPGGYDVQLS